MANLFAATFLLTNQPRLSFIFTGNAIPPSPFFSFPIEPKGQEENRSSSYPHLLLLLSFLSIAVHLWDFQREFSGFFSPKLTCFSPKTGVGDSLLVLEEIPLWLGHEDFHLARCTESGSFGRIGPLWWRAVSIDERHTSLEMESSWLTDGVHDCTAGLVGLLLTGLSSIMGLWFIFSQMNDLHFWEFHAGFSLLPKSRNMEKKKFWAFSNWFERIRSPLMGIQDFRFAFEEEWFLIHFSLSFSDRFIIFF